PFPSSICTTAIFRQKYAYLSIGSANCSSVVRSCLAAAMHFLMTENANSSAKPKNRWCAKKSCPGRISKKACSSGVTCSCTGGAEQSAPACCSHVQCCHDLQNRTTRSHRISLCLGPVICIASADDHRRIGNVLDHGGAAADPGRIRHQPVPCLATLYPHNG